MSHEMHLTPLLTSSRRFLSRFRSLFDDFFNRFFSFLNAFFSFRSRFASLPSELDDEESLSLLDRVRRLPMDGRASLCTRQRAGVRRAW